MRYISWRDFAAKSTLSVSTLKREAAADPTFPRRRQLSSGRVAFVESEADDWLAARA